MLTKFLWFMHTNLVMDLGIAAAAQSGYVMWKCLENLKLWAMDK